MDVRETCPTCHGTGTITPSILLDEQIENKIAYYVNEKHLSYIKLRVSPFVRAFLMRGVWPIRLRWMLKYKCYIRIVSDQSTGFVETKFFRRGNEELV